jgi:hypothetical protein
MVHKERGFSTAFVPGRTGMVEAGQGEARWLTASLLNFQLQGYNTGLPVPLGHPHEHNRKA